MWGAIIGAAAGLAGSLIGGHNARKEKRRQMAIYRDQLRESRANQLRYANEDYSQSAAGQAAVNEARRLQEEQLANARGSDAVTGGHSVDRAVESNAMGSARLGSVLAQQGYNAQRQADMAYGNQARQAENQIAGMHGEQAQQNAEAGANAMNAGMSLAGADLDSHASGGKGILESLFGVKKKGELPGGLEEYDYRPMSKGPGK